MSVTLLFDLDDPDDRKSTLRRWSAKPWPGFKAKISDRNSTISQNVRAALIADHPACLGEQPVDVFSGSIFWGGHFEYYSKTQLDSAALTEVQDLSWPKLQAV